MTKEEEIALEKIIDEVTEVPHKTSFRVRMAFASSIIIACITMATTIAVSYNFIRDSQSRTCQSQLNQEFQENTAAQSVINEEARQALIAKEIRQSADFGDLGAVIAGNTLSNERLSALGLNSSADSSRVILVLTVDFSLASQEYINVANKASELRSRVPLLPFADC